MVGDNLIADVRGANALGMTSIWRAHPGREVDPGAPELPSGWQTPGLAGVDSEDPLTKPDYIIGSIAGLRELPPLAGS
jgi:FMN phosphatase YigB (HAD superfamily)